MIDLYYAPTPNGWKISIMLEECDLDYKVIPMNLGKGDQFKPEFLKIYKRRNRKKPPAQGERYKSYGKVIRTL